MTAPMQVRCTLSGLMMVAAIMTAEVLSDFAAASTDETRALELKADEFWGSILAAAKKANMAEHAQIYKDSEKALLELSGAPHAEVKRALTDAISHLRHADGLVLMQAIQSAKLASSELHKPVEGSPHVAAQVAFSFSSGGQMQSIFKERLRRFASVGTYPEHLVELVEQRQTEMLPLLQGELAITGDVLKDCHEAAQSSFEVLKYDNYRRLRGAPKTPTSAKAVANRIVKASKETRSRFTEFLMDTVWNVAHDALGKRNGTHAIVMKPSISAHDNLLKKGSAQLGAVPKPVPLVDV